MPVIAKMKCSGIKTYEGWYKQKSVIAGIVEFNIQYTNDEKFREFADASPSGGMHITIENPEALKQFTPGKYYDILISESQD